MNCQRCSGHMIQERLYAPDETEMTVNGWRCLNCGEVIDGTILDNRLRAAQGPRRIFCRRGELATPIAVRLAPLPVRPPQSRLAGHAPRRRRPAARAR